MNLGCSSFEGDGLMPYILERGFSLKSYVWLQDILLRKVKVEVIGEISYTFTNSDPWAYNSTDCNLMDFH